MDEHYFELACDDVRELPVEFEQATPQQLNHMMTLLVAAMSHDQLDALRRAMDRAAEKKPRYKSRPLLRVESAEDRALI